MHESDGLVVIRDGSVEIAFSEINIASVVKVESVLGIEPNGFAGETRRPRPPLSLTVGQRTCRLDGSGAASGRFAIKFQPYLVVLLGPIALSLLRLARQRRYACDCGSPYDLHRASSISVKICAAFRCSSMALPAGESGGQSLRALLSRQAMECPAHPAGRSGKIKSPTRILHTIQQPED